MHLNSPGNTPSQGHTSRSKRQSAPAPPPTYPFFQASALRGRQIRHEGFLLKANLLKCIPSFRKQYASKKHLSAAPGAGFGPGQCVCLSSDSRFPGGPQHKSFTADPHKYEILPARLPTQSLQKPLFPQPCRKVPCRRGAGKGIRI